jgi:hypothetical protein
MALAVVVWAAALSAGSAEVLPIRKSHATMVLDTIDKFIVPHLDAFAVETASLTGHVDAVCKDGATDVARRAAAASFAGTLRAWSGLDFFRFGPVMHGHRLERVFFWPDPRATTSRQLNQVLAAREAKLLEPGALARQSVAVQGLTALEILLFDDKEPLGAGTEEPVRYRCAFARAIASNLNAIAVEMKTGWTGDDGFRIKMLTTGSDNVLYKDSSETARDVVKAIATGLDLCSNRFVIPELLAVQMTPPKTVRLPFERAKLGSEFLQASLTALSEEFEIVSLAAYIPPEKPWMAKFLPDAWKALLRDATQLERLRAEERGSEAHLTALRKMKFDLSGIRQIIVRELAPNADLTLGFNELDGD